MPKAGELNWENLYKSGQVDQDPASKAIQDSFPAGNVKDANKGGDKVTPEQLRKEAMDIVYQAHNGPGRQATDEELFGDLVKSQEEIDQMEKSWNNYINDFYKAATQPIEQQDSKDNSDWGNGGKFNDMLSPEELAKRNMTVGD